MKKLAAGKLNNKVHFQKSSVSDDGYNQQIWADDFSKWAEIQTGLAKEVEHNGLTLGEVSHSIKCHYSPKITAAHRVKHKDSLYEIIGKPINVNFSNTITLILVKEVTDA